MPTVDIVILAIAAVLVLIALGGISAAGRRNRAREGRLLDQVRQVNQALADAHAQDKGWKRETLEAAARAVVAERFGTTTTVDGLQLVQVVDKPGTDADQAVFRVKTSAGEHTITLGRTNGHWGSV